MIQVFDDMSNFCFDVQIFFLGFYFFLLLNYCKEKFFILDFKKDNLMKKEVKLIFGGGNRGLVLFLSICGFMVICKLSYYILIQIDDCQEIYYYFRFQRYKLVNFRMLKMYDLFCKMMIEGL